LSRDAKKFTNAVEAIMATNDTLKEEQRKDKLNLKRYLNGLKYIYDNRDEAAVQIANKSCSSVAFYLVTALSGRLDPLRTDFVSYWTTQFENGFLASDSNGPGTYEKPPVSLTWSWNGQYISRDIPFTGKFSVTLDREYEFWAGWVPDLSGGESRKWDGDGGLSALMSRYESWKREVEQLQGMAGQEWAASRLARLRGWMYVYNQDFLPRYEGLLQTNITKVQRAMKDGVQFFVVQRRNNQNDTHFMVGVNIGGTLYLLDHNKVYRKEGQDIYWWGVTYDTSKHNIVRWMWW
jgi:hypothetical protein